MPEVYIVQGHAGHIETLTTEAGADDQIEQGSWTCPKTVKRGDTMCVYLLAPFSAIVATATFTGEAFIENDQESDWHGKPMANYAGVFLLDQPIRLTELRVLFPEWHWTQRPQGSVRVPDNDRLKIKKPFMELLTSRQTRKPNNQEL